MKTSDGFNARRLRNKGPGNWGKRIGMLIALMLAVVGLVLTFAGASSLIGHPQMLGELNASRVAPLSSRSVGYWCFTWASGSGGVADASADRAA
ncbi:hypothetical protein ALP73_01007 [Pseudomonas coronafaciens pv. garcae]|uniref:Uncharacterized protein n=1 Tax=Pseudomonas coronafaciens pv. garcae TaxID=251653 RepID=A0AB37QWI0_9PSED|nr:hypothetical protein ALP73_01007 [Pseudomonas coronafaciens pv. garcae]RMS06207.1 hypothetical protein ALP74_01399 [Pseudomonas coronafaciens pv. garcae]RMS44787.1 hypothetical protein ALP71_02454 [Pseudomonas coronafaciens pv. garcae]